MSNALSAALLLGSFAAVAAVAYFLGRSQGYAEALYRRRMVDLEMEKQKRREE